MAKRKKLTAQLKAKIKKDYKSLRLNDYQGEARGYLKKVKGAGKARKTKEGKIASFGSITIPRDSEIYRIIEKSSKLQKMSVAAFIRKNRDNISALMKDGNLVLDRETDKLIRDINGQVKGAKVYVNDGDGFIHVSRMNAIFQLQQFKQFIASNTNVFMMFFRTTTKLYGDIYFYCPGVNEYEELEDSEPDIIEMLDSYFPNITYLRSDKKAKHETEAPKAKIKTQGKSKKGSKPNRPGKR